MIDFGHGVHLGPLDSRYMDQMRLWRNDPKIFKWCRQNDLISDISQEKWFTRQESDPTIRMYAIMNLESQFVGVCGFTSFDTQNRRAEFSLYINPMLHENGLGTNALKTLLCHGFRNLGLNIIWGESFEGNPACRMFKKMGFAEEGIRHQFYFKDGKFIDAHLFSMSATEWEKSCTTQKFLPCA